MSNNMAFMQWLVTFLVLQEERTGCLILCLFVWFDYLHPSQQFFSYIGSSVCRVTASAICLFLTVSWGAVCSVWLCYFLATLTFSFDILCESADQLDLTMKLHIRAMAWHFQQWGICDQQSLRSTCAYAQSDQSLCLSLVYSMSVKLPTEHNLEFLSLKGGCTGSSESTLVKMPHCWKSHVAAQYTCRLLHCNRWYADLFCIYLVLVHVDRKRQPRTSSDKAYIFPSWHDYKHQIFKLP